MSRLRSAHWSLLCVCILTGCGAGIIPKQSSTGPQIVRQPADVFTPLGTTAQFSVGVADQANSSFQWSRNGIPIPQATSVSLSVGPVASGDDQSEFDVQVKENGSTVTSRMALLRIGPRSPADGDLRFQQVDSSLTRNGYTGLVSGNILGGDTYEQEQAFGVPLSVGPSCNPAAPIIFACGWVYDLFEPAGTTTTLKVGYKSDALSSLSTDLSTLNDGNTVVTGFDIEPQSSAYGLSYSAQADGPTFRGVLHTVNASDLQTSLTAEGVQGNVVTAISYQNGQISFLSYSWLANGSTKFESVAEMASFSNVGSTAAMLAAEGYIITAVGGNEYNGVLLVGTRVQGDTISRPITVIPAGQSPNTLATQGYAIVGVFYSATEGFTNWIGEQ